MEICTMDKPSSQFLTGIGPNNNNDNNLTNNNDSKKLLNNYETIGSENYAVPYVQNLQQQQQQVQQDISEQCNMQYVDNSSDRNWKIENIECKQEKELIPNDNYLDNPNDEDMNLRYNSVTATENYNETFNYGYNNNNNNNSNNPSASNINNSRNSPFFEGSRSTANSAHCSRRINSNNNQNSHLLYSNGNNSNNISNFSPYQMSSSTKSQLPAWYNPPQHPPHHNLPPPAHPSYYPTTPNFFQPHHQPYQVNYMASASTSSDHNMRNMIQMTNRNGREARNRAEKHRRDKLNGSIQELSTMVPHVAESPRRVDKTAVLRFSAHGLRIDYVFGQDKNNRYLINPRSTEGLMKLLDTFLLTVTCRGNIVLVSSSVEQYLGHCRSDLYGQSLLNITHPDDHAFLKQQLIPTDLHNLFSAKTDENGEIRSRTNEEEEEIDLKLREDRRDFTIRLARAGPRSEPTQYELVRIDGCFKRAESAPRGRPNAGPTGLQLIRRARGRDDNIPLHSISGNDIILIAMARVIKPPMFCDRLIEACRYEYKTRHLVDGRIVQCDQRISIVAGYMTEEISGLSPFTFMHRDDVRWVMVALRQMYDFGSPVGESCYRLMSRTGQFIYLKTKGILEIDERTRQVHSFMCLNTLVSDDEGRRLIKEMKRKFSAIISEEELSKLESDVPAVENPQLLERAILNLITNLNNASYDDDDTASIVSDSTIHEDQKHGKLPLAIIPPNTVSVKPTVAKGINIISQMRGKDIQIKDEPKSPESQSPSAGEKHSSFKTQSSTNDDTMHYNIKTEPGIGGMLSPTSSFSVSSHDSDICSPQQHNQNEIMNASAIGMINASSSSRQHAARANQKADDFYSTPYENLPSAHPYDNDSISIRNSSSDSFSSSFSNFASAPQNDSTSLSGGVNLNNNNNNSSSSNKNNNNIIRSSVLKRTHNDADNDHDDYTELIKKRVLINDLTRVPQQPPPDLLASSSSDISDVLSTFPDDSLTEQFGYNDIVTTPQSHGEELTAEQEEQREILNSLRESCSVIQQTPKSSDYNSNTNNNNS
ncbi:uncharacterized protein [Chironomus tepperi]|uniref:uncharacterized protein isoform X2 n=1 Tax=Chironomus tepperi TaxID=113505 RepID=UPI00391F19DB